MHRTIPKTENKPDVESSGRLLKRIREYIPMGERKKAKLEDNKAPASDAGSLRTKATQTSSESNGSKGNEGAEANTKETATASVQPSQLDQAPSKEWKLRGRNSWYGSGSWRSKASPVIAQVARENVGVTGGSTQELPGPTTKQPTVNTPADLLSKRRSSKSIPIAASTTKLHVSSNGDEESTISQEGPKDTVADPPLPPDPEAAAATEQAAAEKDKPDNASQTESKRSSMWTSWWSRPDDYSTLRAKPALAAGADQAEAAAKTPLPGTTPVEEDGQDRKRLGEDAKQNSPMQVPEAPEVREEQLATTSEKPVVQAKSWFSFWSNAENTRNNSVRQPATPTTPTTKPVDVPQPTGHESPPKPASVRDQPISADVDSNEPTTKKRDKDQPDQLKNVNARVGTIPAVAAKASSWAFWSKDTPSSHQTSENVHKEVGEIAVADTPSQSKPEAAQFNEQERNRAKESVQTPTAKGKPRLKDLGKKTLLSKSTSASAVDLSKEAQVADNIKSPDTATTKASRNLLLPEFRDTYKLVQTPSIWQKIRTYLLGSEIGTPHLHIAPTPPRIKKALAIGVHGFFPAQYIRTIIGQPTGTSIRFANAAANAIHEWTQNHGGYSCEVEKVALEGEGFIEERVSTLWKLLLNWIDHVRQADFILVACHSQGVPVAIMLVAKLIAFGCLSPSVRIGICAMAGINLGPFVEYKTRYLGNTAAELFQFSDPKSKVSKDYMAALKELLENGVKIVYVGSIDDQLVSLESSTFSNISHPYIYRAVFVDRRLHAPDFITHLVAFVLKLRNLGLPDHGLIRELSPAVAGSLYTGEGHSRIHEDPQPYSLAVTHVLETTNLPQSVPLGVREYEGTMSTTNPNPYYLPWAMRGLLEEEFVKRELGKEVDELLSLFEAWKPITKGLKDIKFRLEAVRSKL